MNTVYAHRRLFNLSPVTFLLVGVGLGFLVSKGLGIYVIFLYAGTGFLVLSLYYPLKAFSIFIILYPLFSTLSISLGNAIPDITFNRASVAIIVFAILFRIYTGKSKLLRVSKSEVGMILFCIISSASMFLNYKLSGFIETMLFFTDSFIIPFILFFIAKIIFLNEKDFINFTKILIIPAIYLSIMGIYEHITWNDLLPVTYSSSDPEYVQGLRINMESGILRVNGPFRFPETFGLVLAMILLMLSYHIGSRASKVIPSYFVKPMNVFVLPLLTIGLYFNMFRGIWLGAIAGLITRFGIIKGQRLKVIIFISLVALLMWTSSEMIKSSTVYNQRILNTRNIYARIATYKIAIALILDNPIKGIGFNNFTKICEKYNYSNAYAGTSSVKQAHNSYLAIFAENGILGFITYLLIMSFFFTYVIELYRKRNRINQILAAIFLGILIVYLFPSFFFNISRIENINNLFYSLMGALTGLVYSKRKL